LDELNNKKSKAIDLVLEGIISREDLKRQVQVYDAEIECVSQQLLTAQNEHSLYQNQSENLQIYIDEVNRIMNFGSENTLLYREFLDTIVLYDDNVLCVHLNCIPYAIKLKYETQGKAGTFQVDIRQVDTVDTV